MAKRKEMEVIDRGGAKTVAKKTALVTHAKRIFLIVSVIWLGLTAWFPLYVKSHYAEPIKKSMVVSMFFDLQRNIADQYEKLLGGIKKSINIEKPVAAAIDKVKIVGAGVDKVTDATATAKKQTAAAKGATSNVRTLTGIAGKFGVKTDAVDNAVARADKELDSANAAVAKVDNIAKTVNEKLDKVEKDLNKTLQTQIDKTIDDAVKKQLDKNTGGLGTTLLTDYGIKHVYAWRPSSWAVATKIYNDLAKSNVGVLQILTRTVDEYFGYVAWGLVIIVWAAGLAIWMIIRKKYKMIVAPFIVCPRCGHAFADRRSVKGWLKILQPWKWF